MKLNHQKCALTLASFLKPVLALALMAGIQVQGQNVYNTGYSTSSTPNGVVDNQWQVTAISNLPGGYALPATPPYAAFVSGANGAYDMSTGPSGQASSWITFNNPPFEQQDTAGIVTTYTLNFNAPVGNYQFNFEADNGVSIFLGAVNPVDQVYTDGINGADGVNGSDFARWHSTLLNITSGGANQLNIQVFNNPNPGFGANPTALRVDFTTPVPEPATWGLMAMGAMGMVVRMRRGSR